MSVHTHHCLFVQCVSHKIVGDTETTISNWENGRSGRNWFERVARLCKALNCAPEDLIESAPDAELREENGRLKPHKLRQQRSAVAKLSGAAGGQGDGGTRE